MARCNKSFFAILGIISKGEMSGYDIRTILEKTSRFYWSESNAQIYPTLKTLEEKGYVVSRVMECSGARQCRKYTITDEGQKKLMIWLEETCEFPKHREEMLLKMTMAQHMPTELILKHVLQYEKEVDERLIYLREVKKHIESHFLNQPRYPFLLITYNHVDLVLKAKKQWVKETVEQLKKMKRVV